MKHNLLYPFVIAVLLFNSNYLFAQNAGILYEMWSPNSDCNIFMNSTFVNNVQHRTVLGQPTYDGSQNSVSLKAIMIQKPYPPHEYRGTSFRINYPFKKGYKYRILILASRGSGTPASSVRLGLELVNTSITSSGCAGPESMTYNISETDTRKRQFIIGNIPADLDYRFNTLQSAFAYLVLTAMSDNTTEREALIKNIRIEETAPELVLAPATLATTCGVSTTQTFSVSNPSGIDRITFYEWNLGAASNGWLYNGSPASQNITTTTNSISLTSVCNATTVRNVGVTIKVNNVNYKSYTSTITRSTTTPIIAGATNFCYATPNYSISNLPCNATVSWSASGAFSIAGSSTANPVNLSYSGMGDGVLTATVIACSGTPVTVSKTISAPTGFEFGTTGSPSSFCDSKNFYVIGLPLNAPITWSVTGDITINGSVNAHQVMIDAINPNSYGTITADFFTPCSGNITLTRQVYTSPQIENARITYGGGYYEYPNIRSFDGGPMTIEAEPLLGASYYDWLDEAENIIATTTQPILTTYNYSNDCGVHFLRIRATVYCGGIEQEVNTAVLYDYRCLNYGYRIYPNPANNELTISADNSKENLTEGKATDAKNKIFEVSLYNNKGEKLNAYQNSTSKDNKLLIDTSNIPNGTYYLHIKEGDKTIKQQVIVKH
jgi:hypothetical protein